MKPYAYYLACRLTTPMSYGRPNVFAAPRWIGELTNSFVLSRMKVATRGRFLWSRTIGSTIVGQGLDSAIFVTIAFAGTGVELGETIVTTWLIKVAWEAAATPLTYAVANGLKLREGIDTFDAGGPTPAVRTG